ncbi:hypothetical protein [Runella slithyformis]|uniref:Glycosyltransferase RgtA/B/C/D-like domain-containing protein n=1 Tax=Runella slithyformis (strain ATCC 29530 / DSM 19594 / LMG 11500 / NCIMB 11436 / LSU 4) TaxID=761193 RepID=A0A7U3ZL70_RUNSL|nr:hypothetical protein [Runella slithyformis]AEI49262.1 hypothetical protein Runsl_2874 [Runella slithyformis DSM 19594]
MDKTKTVNRLLAGCLVVIFLLRWSHMADREPNIDTSTWLAGVISVDKSSDPIWTWLNYTDGRPLTVAPLLIARALGFEASYPVAEGVGIICWLITLLILYKTLRWLSLSALHALILLAPILCWLGTTGYHDHIAYNSEAISVLMLTAGVSAYVFAFYRRGLSDVARQLPFSFWLCLGIWFGLLAYAKFQNVPMGLVMAAFFAYELLARLQWKNVFWLVLGGVLPTILINLYFAWYGELTTFWNNYFWYYFYYGYSDEFSKLPIFKRFSPWRAGSLMWQSNAIRFAFSGLCLAVFVAFWGGGRKRSLNRWDRLLLFAGCYLIVTFYAVLQSGNPYTHYTLFLPVPLTFLIGVVVSRPSTGHRETFKNWVYGIVLISGIGQGVFNSIEREPLLPLWHDNYDQQLVKIIKANTQPNDRLVIWGYADRLYIYTGLPMGFRWPYTIGIYWPSALHDIRVDYFLKDMLQNKPVIFVDLNGSFINTEGNAKHRHENFPPIANFVRQHYQMIAQVKDGSPEGVRIYKLK